jgi:hypothetical protein
MKLAITSIFGHLIWARTKQTSFAYERKHTYERSGYETHSSSTAKRLDLVGFQILEHCGDSQHKWRSHEVMIATGESNGMIERERLSRCTQNS